MSYLLTAIFTCTVHIERWGGLQTESDIKDMNDCRQKEKSSFEFGESDWKDNMNDSHSLTWTINLEKPWELRKHSEEILLLYYNKMDTQEGNTCVRVCVSYHVADPRKTGSRSHQYQSPAELYTPISRDTNMPLKPWWPPATSTLYTQTQNRNIYIWRLHFANKYINKKTLKGNKSVLFFL